MPKLFEFVEHIGKYRVLVQTRDIHDKAVTTPKIEDGAVTGDKIAEYTIKLINIDKDLMRVLEAATGIPESLLQHFQELSETIDELSESVFGHIQSDIKDLIGRANASEHKQEQLENSFRDIVLSGGGASTANAVTFDNSKSGLDSINAQDAIDELATSKVYLTEAAYDALVASGNVNPDVEYNVYEEEE